MDQNTEGSYWSEEDKKDREFRRGINDERVYTERARCDVCGDWLDGRGSSCSACRRLLCNNCIGGDGRCDECSGSGREDLPEE